MKVGVTTKAPEWFFDLMFADGIDLNWEQFLLDLQEEEELSEEDRDDAMENYESQGCSYLVGDWKQDKDSKWEINKEGEHGFSATYDNSNADTVCVEWSKTTKECHHTSPCFVMADGSGPCGDLDTEGTSVVAYCLPD